MRRSKKYVLPVLVVAALAAIGAASTNAISFSGSGASKYADVGYGAITTNTNVAVSNVHYVTADAGQTITEVDVTFATALLTTDDVNIAFNQDGQTGGSAISCTDGGSETLYACTGLTQSVAAVTDLDISVIPGT